MQAYLHKRPAQLAAFIAEQRRFAKLFAAPASAPFKLLHMDFDGLEQRIRAAPLATWGMNAPRLKPRAFYPADFGDFAITPPLTPAPPRDYARELMDALSSARRLQFEDRAAGLGYRHLGSGYYADAFAHPVDPTKVIKVGCDPTDGWVAYARWCVNHQGEEFVPKIYELRRYSSPHGERYYAVMEKLYELPKRGEGASMWYWRSVVNQIEVFIKSGCSSSHAPDSRAAEAFGRKLYAAFGAPYMDLHSGNMMMNHAGHLVVTDPYSDSPDGSNLMSLPT